MGSSESSDGGDNYGGSTIPIKNTNKKESLTQVTTTSYIKTPQFERKTEMNYEKKNNEKPKGKFKYFQKKGNEKPKSGEMDINEYLEKVERRTLEH